MRIASCAAVALAIAGADAAAQSASTSSGQAFPSKPIRIVVAFPAGGPVDLSARTLAPKLSTGFGQPVVVDNRAGAAQIIAAEAVAKSPPDGYTWLMVTNGIAINPSVYRKLPYDTINDLAPTTLVSKSPFILIAHPSLPVKNAAELVRLAKARPGELMYSTSGVGSANHLPTALFNIMAGINTTHVPYKGTVPSLGAVIAGEVHFQFSNPIASIPMMRAGKVKVLATGGSKRLPSLPDVPTISESAVKGFEAGPWFAIFAPAATPREIVQRMQGEVQRALAQPDVKQVLTAEGAELIGSTPEALGAQLKADIAKWAKVVQVAGVKAE